MAPQQVEVRLPRRRNTHAIIRSHNLVSREGAIFFILSPNTFLCFYKGILHMGICGKYLVFPIFEHFGMQKLTFPF